MVASVSRLLALFLCRGASHEREGATPAVPKPKVRKQRKRFAARRDAAYQQWVREFFPCWFCLADHRVQVSPTECEHLKTRSSGGDDFDNILPTCEFHRVRRDVLGPKTFFNGYAQRGRDPWKAAQKLTKLYRIGRSAGGD